METVFHDVPYVPGFKQIPKAKLRDLVHSQVTTTRPMVLVDLGAVALRKLGIRRNQLIDTENTEYETTQKWAAAFHAQDDTVQGICWTSRQDDRATAVVLFGDRISASVLQASSLIRALEREAFADVLQLAAAIDVCFVDAKL